MLANSTGQQRSAMVDGIILTGKQLDEYVDKHGRCPICKTVVRKRAQFWSNWEPVTVGPNPHTGEYEVYKGYCIQPTCYTLDQVKIMLGEPLDRKKRTTKRVSIDNSGGNNSDVLSPRPGREGTTIPSPSASGGESGGGSSNSRRYNRISTSPSPRHRGNTPINRAADTNLSQTLANSLPPMPTLSRSSNDGMSRSARSPPRRLEGVNIPSYARSERGFGDCDSQEEPDEGSAELGHINSLREFAKRGDFVNFLVEMDLNHFKDKVAKEGFYLLRNAVMEIHKTKPSAYLFKSDTWVKTVKTALLAKNADEETVEQGLLVFMSFSGVSPAYRRDALQYPTVDAILTVRDRFHDNLNIEDLCCACLEVLFLDNTDTEWRLKSADAEKVIEALITVMNTRKENRYQSDFALRALFNLSLQEHFKLDTLPVADRVNEALSVNNGVDLLTRTLHGNDGLSDMVAEAALYLLWRLSLPAPNADGATFQAGSGILPTENIIETILEAMKMHESSMLAQQAGCGILCNLMLPSNIMQYPPSLAKRTREAIVKSLSGGYYVDLSSHPNVKTLQMVHLNGLLAIHNLLCNVLLKNALVADTDVISSPIVTSMNLFHDKPVIQAVGCMALSRVCGMGTEQKRAVFSAGGMDAVAEAFRNYVKSTSTEEKNSRSIFDGACTIAASLSMLPEARSELIRSDLLENIQEVFLRDPSIAALPSAQFVMTTAMTMANGSNPEALLNNFLESSNNKVELAESCFVALSSAALQSEDYMRKLLACHGGHGTDCLMDVMERFPASIIVQQEGIAILALVYYNFPFTGILGNVSRIGGFSVKSHTEREVNVIRSAMRLHRPCAAIQENGFVALSNFIAPICGRPDGFDPTSTLFTSSLKDIQEAIVMNKNSPSVYKSAIRFFWTLTFVAREDDMQVWSLRIMQQLFDCMRRFPDDDEMQLMACDALLRLLDDERRLELVCQREEFETVFKCVNFSNEAVVVRASEIVATLLVSYFPASNQIVEIANAIEQLVLCMETYMASEEIQLHLCSIMKSLVTLQDDFVKHIIVGCGGLKSLMDAATRYSHNKMLVEDAVLAMKGVARALTLDLITPMREMLGTFVIRVIEHNMENPDLEAAVLGLLWVLCGQDEYFKRLISEESNSIPQIIDVMNQHIAASELQKEGCSILWVLSGFKDNKLLIGRSGGIRSIVNAMDAHTTDTALQKEALTAIKNLSTARENNHAILRFGAEDAVRRVLWINMDFPQVLAAGFSALNNIAVDSESRTVARMQEEVLELILHAMTRFPTNENVQKNAVFLLKSYSYFDDNLRIMVRRADDLMLLLAVAAEGFPKECQERAYYLMRKIELTPFDLQR